jgi:hypothetical protein
MSNKLAEVSGVPLLLWLLLLLLLLLLLTMLLLLLDVGETIKELEFEVEK